MTREELYVHGLITILAEGACNSAELIEGRPLPDLVSLAGDDERLRAWVEKHPSAREHENFAEVFRIITGLQGLRWDFLSKKGTCDLFNSTEGSAAWHRLTLEKLKAGGGRRGLRVTVHALEPEEAAAEAVKRSGLSVGRLIAILNFLAIQLSIRLMPSWVTGALLLSLVGTIALAERRQTRREARQADGTRKQILAYRALLYRGIEQQTEIAPDPSGSSPGQVSGVLVEFSLDTTSKILAAYADGAAVRLYTDGEMFSAGPDFTDPVQLATFKPVVAASKALISTAEPFLKELSPQEGRPLPEPGRIRLVMLTPGGIHAVEEDESSVENRTSRFLPIHQAAKTLDMAINRAVEKHAASFRLPGKTASPL